MWSPKTIPVNCHFNAWQGISCVQNFILLVESHKISKKNEYHAFYPGYIKSLIRIWLDGELLIIFYGRIRNLCKWTTLFESGTQYMFLSNTPSPENLVHSSPNDPKFHSQTLFPKRNATSKKNYGICISCNGISAIS